MHLAATLGAPYFFSSAGSITLFWPATGIALAATLAGGYRYAYATVISCTIAAFIAPEKGIAQFFFSTANALEIFLARFLLLRLAKIDIAFDRASDYLKFILHAGILLPVPAALIAAFAVIRFTPSTMPFWFHAQEWWMSDSLGILSLTPLLLIWRKMPSGWFTARLIPEAIIGLVLTAVAGYYLLEYTQFGMAAYPYGYLFFIVVAWAATRFGRHATLLITTVVIAFALAGARLGGRPLNANAIHYANVWLFLVTLSTVGMALATVFNERRAALRKNAQLLEAYRNEERKRQESDNALRKTTIDFERLMETASEGIWTIDTEGKTTFANNRMAAMLGYTTAEMLGKSFMDFMPAADRKTGASRLDRRISGISEEHESALVRKDGATILTLMYTSPITDIEGNVSGALAMVTDISEKKKAEESLRESEDRNKKVLEKIRDAVLIHQSGITMYANPAAAELLGFADVSSMIGVNGIAMLHPEDKQKIIDRAQQLIEKDTGTYLPPIRQRIVRNDGITVTCESITTSVRFNGRSAMLVIAHEISREKTSP